MKKIFLIALVFITVNGFTQNRYVSPGGSDAGAGTVGDPWQTIGKAATTMTPGSGDTCYLTAGTHTVAANIAWPVGLHLKGVDTTNTTVQGTITAAYNAVLSLTSATQGTMGNQTISNIRFQTTVTAWCIAVFGRSNVKIFNCIFEGFIDRGVIFSGTTGTGPSNEVEPTTYATLNEFHHNRMLNCSRQAGGTGTGDLNIGGQKGMKVYNNSIRITRPVTTGGYPIKYQNEGWLWGVEIYNNYLEKPVMNNIMNAGYDWPFAIEGARLHSGCKIYNNTIVGAGIDNNICWPGDSTYSIHIYNNSIKNPSPVGWDQYGIVLEFNTSKVLVENNIFENMSWGIGFTPRSVQQRASTNDGGFVSNVTIQKNLFLLTGASNTGNGQFIYCYSDGGAHSYNWNNINILNNTMLFKGTNPGPWGIGFPFSDAGGSIKNWRVQNNIISGTLSAPFVQCGSSCGSKLMDSVRITHNNVYGNGNSNAPLWTSGNVPTNYTYNNNITTAPAYDGTSAPFIYGESYIPQTGANVVNAGTDVGLFYIGSNPDIGYYELGTAVAADVTINQAAGQADPTSAIPINFTVVFTGNVTGFTTGDVTITGTAGGTKVGTVTGSGATYNIAVTGMTSSGTVIATIGAGVASSGGQPNNASTSTDNTVQYNLPPAPSVTINQAAGQADPTTSYPVLFNIVFNYPVTGLVAADISVTGTAGATTGLLYGSGSTYQFAVYNMTGSGTVIATIQDSVAVDGIGQPNNASTSTDNTIQYNVPASEPGTDPLTKSNQWIEIKFVKTTGGLILAVRDTSWTPEFVPTLVWWNNAIWVYSQTFGQRWNTVAGGAGGGGNMTGSNNLSELTNTATARTNLGLGNVDNTSDENKPVSDATLAALDYKQATLVNQTNIKSINGTSLLGSGDLTISGGGSWTPAIDSTTSAPTHTINMGTLDIYRVKNQTENCNIAAGGTPYDGKIFEFQFTGTGVRTITWGSSFVSSTVSLPSTMTTTTSTVVLQWYVYSSYGNGKWVCVNVY